MHVSMHRKWQVTGRYCTLVRTGDKATTTRLQRNLVYRTAEGHTCLRRCLRLIVEVSRNQSKSSWQEKPTGCRIGKNARNNPDEQKIMSMPCRKGDKGDVLLCIHLTGNVAIGHWPLSAYDMRLVI